MFSHQVSFGLVLLALLLQARRLLKQLCLRLSRLARNPGLFMLLKWNTNEAVSPKVVLV
jgi:hypothetical protein